MPLLLLVDRSLAMLSAGVDARYMETAINGVSAVLDTLARLDPNEHVSVCVFNDQVEPIKLPSDDVDHMNINYVRRANAQQTVTRLQRVICESIADVSVAMSYAHKQCTQKWHSGVAHRVMLVTHSTSPADLPGNASLAVVHLDPLISSDAIVSNMTDHIHGWYGTRSRITTLRMGQLPAFSVRLHPSIDISTVDIIGFVPSPDVRDVPLTSRHSMTAVCSDGPSTMGMSKFKLNKAQQLTERTPHLCPLLYRSMSAHSLSALARVSDDDDYALITVCEDNLSLDVLPPGAHSVPWLGALDQMVFHPVTDAKTKSVTSLSLADTSDEMSYGQAQLTNWTSHSKLQDDLQKILRSLRRERYTQLYDDLARVLSHARVLGSLDVGQRLATMITTELASNANMKNANVQRHGSHILTVIRQGDYKYGMPIAQAE